VCFIQEIEHAFGGISEDANDDYMKHVKKKIAEELMAKSNCKSLLDDFDPWKCPVETLSPLSDTPHFNGKTLVDFSLQFYFFM
jgi:hypothetical protein